MMLVGFLRVDNVLKSNGFLDIVQVLFYCSMLVLLLEATDAILLFI